MRSVARPPEPQNDLVEKFRLPNAFRLSRSVDEPEDGSLIALGKLSDDAEVAPEALLLGRLTRRFHLGRRLEPEEFV